MSIKRLMEKRRIEAQAEFEKEWLEIDDIVREKVGMCKKCWEIHKGLHKRHWTKILDLYDITQKVNITEDLNG